MNNVLITGYSRGIGKALKEVLKKQGDNVFGYSRSELGDIREIETINKLKKLSNENNLNLLINNVGIYSDKKIKDEDPSKIKDIIDVNLIAPMIITNVLWPILIKNKGTVIMINSIAGRIPSAGEIAYRTSKFGLTGFSGTLFFEGKYDGVRVIDIPLNGVNTEMLKDRPKKWDVRQQPESAANLIVDILKNKNSKDIKHFLLSSKIIDNEVNT